VAKSTTLMDKVQAGAKAAAGEDQLPVGKLAAEQGLPAAPVTAYGTALIGGSPQQAKMAGVPAQKKAAFAQVAAPTGESQLEQAQTLAAPAEATAEEEAKKQQAAKYAESLGTFGAKVSEWVEAAKKKITGQQATVQVDVSDKLLAGLDAGKKTQATDILRQVAVETDPAKKNQLETQLNTLIGRDALSTLTDVEKQELYQSVASSIGAAATAGQEAVVGADRKLTLSDMTNLGTTQQELATLLGMDEKAVGDLSIAQLQQKIAEVSQQQFGVTQQVKAGLASSALSSADRAALRQYLRGVEQTGVAGAEAAVAGLVAQIDRDQTVTFAGKSYSVEELLGTPAINDVLQKAIVEMEGTTKTGPTVEALKQSSPEMYKWLTDNYTGVKTLIDQSAATSKSYGELQKANVAALGTIGETQPELAAAWGFDPKALRAEAIDPTKLPGGFQSIAAMPKEQQQTAAGTLAQLNQVAGVDATKGLTKEQVDKLQLTNPTGPAAAYLNAANDNKALQNASYIDDVIKNVSAGDESVQQLNDELKDDALAVALGLPASNAAQLDVNKDGKIDEKDMAGIKSQYGKQLPSLADVANGVKPQSGSNQFKLGTPALSTEQSTLFDTMKNVLADGFFTQEEADTLPWSEEKMISVLNSLPRQNGVYIGAGGQIANTLQGAIERKQKQRATAEVAAESERVRKEAEEKSARREQEEAAARKKRSQWWRNI